MTEKELMQWARPYETLLPGEQGRADEYMKLFIEAATRMTPPGEELSYSTLVFARLEAANLWQMMRDGADAHAIQKQVVQVRNHREARRNAFLETDERIRLRTLRLGEISQLREAHDKLMQSLSDPVGLKLVEEA